MDLRRRVGTRLGIVHVNIIAARDCCVEAGYDVLESFDSTNRRKRKQACPSCTTCKQESAVKVMVVSQNQKSSKPSGFRPQAWYGRGLVGSQVQTCCHSPCHNGGLHDQLGKGRPPFLKDS